MSERQRVKYVGPLDRKEFRGYHFMRDVSDDATGGVNALELPDKVANEALRHRDVFMQWNHPVPQAVKDLRLLRPDAIQREGKVGLDHWVRRVAAAENLPNDNKRQKAIRQGEIDGAKAQVAHFRGIIGQAHAERAKAYGEIDQPVPVSTDEFGASEGAPEILDMLEQFREALVNANTVNQGLRAELKALRDDMERNGRLSTDEPITMPSIGDSDTIDLEAEGYTENGGDSDKATPEELAAAELEAAETLAAAGLAPRRRRAGG